MNTVNAILVSLGLIVPAPPGQPSVNFNTEGSAVRGGYHVGSCYTFSWGGKRWTECANYPDGGDPLLASIVLNAVGTRWLLGPWSTDADLVGPALRVIADGRTIIMNAELGGDAMVTIRGQSGLVDNTTIRPMNPP